MDVSLTENGYVVEAVVFWPSEKCVENYSFCCSVSTQGKRVRDTHNIEYRGEEKREKRGKRGSQHSHILAGYKYISNKPPRLFSFQSLNRIGLHTSRINRWLAGH